MEGLGAFGLIHLALAVYAIIQILGSRVEVLRKVIWILVVAVFPLVGLII
jgi:hypothetical protein